MPADPTVTALLIIFGPRLPDSRKDHVRIGSTEQTVGRRTEFLHPAFIRLVISHLMIQRRTRISVNARWPLAKENTRRRTSRALKFTLIRERRFTEVNACSLMSETCEGLQFVLEGFHILCENMVCTVTFFASNGIRIPHASDWSTVFAKRFRNAPKAKLQSV